MIVKRTPKFFQNTHTCQFRTPRSIYIEPKPFSDAPPPVFIYLQRRLKKIKFFYLWLQKTQYLRKFENENEEIERSLLLLQMVKNNQQIYIKKRAFLRWKLRMESQLIDKSLEIGNLEIDKSLCISNPKYLEFITEYQEIAAVNARNQVILETIEKKLKKLNQFTIQLLNNCLKQK